MAVGHWPVMKSCMVIGRRRSRTELSLLSFVYFEVILNKVTKAKVNQWFWLSMGVCESGKGIKQTWIDLV